MAFYDEQWDSILKNSPFSEEVEVTLADGSRSVKLCGFFYSGTYGERSEARYVRAKAVAKWTFQTSAGNLPDGVGKVELRNAILVRKGFRYRITNLTGADSGIVNMELYVTD